MPRDRPIDAPLDMDKIAQALGAERRGKVESSGGYLGAMQLLADIEARVRRLVRPKKRASR